MSFFMNWSLFSYAGLVWNRKFSNIYSSLSLYVYNCLYVHRILWLCTQSFLHEYTSFFTNLSLFFSTQSFSREFKSFFMNWSLFLCTQVFFHEFMSFFMNASLFSYAGLLWFIRVSFYVHISVCTYIHVSLYVHKAFSMNISLFPWNSHSPVQTEIKPKSQLEFVPKRNLMWLLCDSKKKNLNSNLYQKVTSDFTENVTPPNSTKSRDWHSSVQIQIQPKSQ